LLPVDEMLFWGNFQRVAQDAGAGVRSGAEPDDLRAEINGAVVAVLGAVMEGDVYGHRDDD
jgi:hypothetical protein